jgi:hypothetical protein
VFPFNLNPFFHPSRLLSGSLEFGHFSVNAGRSRCVPEGRLDTRPAIYRRYWCLEFDLVPEERSKLRRILGLGA